MAKNEAFKAFAMIDLLRLLHFNQCLMASAISYDNSIVFTSLSFLKLKSRLTPIINVIYRTFLGRVGLRCFFNPGKYY